MFHKLLTASTLAALLMLQGCAGVAPDTAVPTDTLLPEVAQIVLNPELLDEAVLMQDVYVGLLAIQAPEGADYMAIGSQIVLHSFDILQKSIQAMDLGLMSSPYDGDLLYGDKKPLTLDLDMQGEKFKFPCVDIYAHECAAQTLHQKASIVELIERNAVVMNRYLQITQLSHYGSYLYRAADRVPSYQYVVQLSTLRLAQAIMALDAGDVDKGFTLLEAEMAFTKRMLAEDHILFGQMIAVRRLYTVYHVISVAMAMPSMREHLHDARWAALLAPLNLDEQKGMAQTLATERNAGLYFFYAFNGQSQNRGEQWFFKVFYNRYATVNMHYLSFEPLIQRASLSLEDVAKLVQQNRLDDVDVAAKNILDREWELLAEKEGVFFNTVGRKLLQFAPGGQEYLNRRYDVQIYGALVNAKRLMLQADVKADEVDAFMQNSEASMRNPYSQDLFLWDAKAQVLSAPWLFIARNVAGDNERMSVHIELKN